MTHTYFLLTKLSIWHMHIIHVHYMYIHWRRILEIHLKEKRKISVELKNSPMPPEICCCFHLKMQEKILLTTLTNTVHIVIASAWDSKRTSEIREPMFLAAGVLRRWTHAARVKTCPYVKWKFYFHFFCYFLTTFTLNKKVAGELPSTTVK